MKPLMVLVSIIATAFGGNAGGFAGGFGSGGGGLAGNNAGYPGGGGGGGYSGAHGSSNNGGGFTGGIGGYSGGGAGGLVGGGGGFGSGFNSGGGFQSGGGGGNDGGSYSAGGGQIRKFVSVHVGPEEPQFTQTKVIRAGGAPDKHVNIIFVKAPSASSQQNTEVILPEAPQQKTLVYVLVKKQESNSNVRVRGPAPTRPSKPEVYFIRYKDSVGPAAVPVGPAVFGGDVGGGVPGPAPGPAYIPPQSAGPVSVGGY